MTSLKDKIKEKKQREADLKRRQDEELMRREREERLRQEKVKRDAFEIQMQKIAQEAEDRRKFMDEKRKQKALEMGLKDLPKKPEIGDLPHYDQDEQHRKFDEEQEKQRVRAIENVRVAERAKKDREEKLLNEQEKREHTEKYEEERAQRELDAKNASFAVSKD